MKIGIYICSNGYGHFHRMLQVCSNLPYYDIDIYCERYQYNRFNPQRPIPLVMECLIPIWTRNITNENNKIKT